MGIRDEQRRQQTATIAALARELLAEHGAAGLSLREIARRMGQSSSALYRYFKTRDELLTRLILDAYNELGETVERAERVVDRDDVRRRFLTTAKAVRRWAKQHPHEYALIYGSPVPGYEAPVETIQAATRVTAVLAAIVAVAFHDEPTSNPHASEQAILLHELRDLLPHVAPERVARALTVWSSIFGLISFELFGHFVGSVRQASAFYDNALEELWEMLSAPLSS